MTAAFQLAAPVALSAQGVGARLGNTQVHLHMERLVDLEYVIVRRDGPGGKNFFELAYDTAPTDSAPHLPGLIDVETLTERHSGVIEGENNA